MGFFLWIKTNWVDLFQTAAILGGFLAIFRDKRKECVQNLIRFTERHDELWSRQRSDPKLARVTEKHLDLAKKPVSPDEEQFVFEVLNHFRSTVFASERGVYIQPSALPDDIRLFFGQPIPLAVWQKSKAFYDSDFVAFVEKHL